ncbi:hypothetical protein Lesp02_52750 [Lentzea sp. NBRC 105346]|nr:hypothetical protein Lesp02_52750 [Lentzea sp. NBRC 105346]
MAVIQANATVRTTCDTNADSPKLKAATAAATPLMTWYDNWHWDSGNGSVTWYGYAGTCDQSGYRINFDDNNFPAWRNRISSWKVHGDCWVTFAYDRPYDLRGPSIRIDGDVYFINDHSPYTDWNDSVEAFWITSRR